MQHLGEVFQKIRQARGLKLRDLASKGLSCSQISRFEHGVSDLTISKFMVALTELNLSLTEFMCVAQGFRQDELHELFARLDQCMLTRDSVALKKMLVAMLEDEQRHSKFWKLNTILLKLKLQELTARAYVTAKELHYLTEYLFSVADWGLYELLLFMHTMEVMPHASFMLLVREMVHKSEFYTELPENRQLIVGLLLHGYLRCIECQKLVDALYFEKQLRQCALGETELYERLMFHYCQNLYQYQKDKSWRSLIEVRKCIGVLRLVASDNLAQEYEKQIARIIKRGKNCR